MELAPITPALAEEIFHAVDDADTAFAVINLHSENLTPQARGEFQKAWRKIQNVRAKLKPNSPYAEAIAEVNKGR